MEKERFFAASWHSSSLELKTGVAASVDQLPEPPFLNLAWEQQPLMNRDPPFESAFSSLVSSPSSNPPAAPNDSNVIHELIGRLDSICNSGEATPTSSRCHSAHTSCYSTPLNSPPKLNLAAMDILLQTRGGLPVPAGQMAVVHFAPFAADPGFAERAARFSCFGGRSFGGLDSQFALPEAGKLSRVSSSQSLKAVGNAKDAPMADPERVDIEARSKFGGRTPGPSTPDEPEFAHGKEATSASDRATVGGPKNNVSKRKSAPKAKTKQAQESAGEEHPDAKRSKPVDVNGFGQDSAVKPKTEQNGDAGEKQGTENNNAKLPEPPKDYIHVRARRGQATDSHSLAERVRREKISERMKFLQDLVPGCNRLTGKAVMLDEIINYVQSLQRQVEFLSMKLTALNPQLDTNAENLVPKDIHEGHVPPAFSQQLHQLDLTSAALSYAQQPLQGIIGNAVDAQGSLDALDSLVHRCPSLQVPPLYGFSDATSQLGNLWVDDLNYVVQTGFAQSQGTTAFSSQGLQAE